MVNGVPGAPGPLVIDGQEEEIDGDSVINQGLEMGVPYVTDQSTSETERLKHVSLNLPFILESIFNIYGFETQIVKRLGLGLGTWDLGPRT